MQQQQQGNGCAKQSCWAVVDIGHVVAESAAGNVGCHLQASEPAPAVAQRPCEGVALAASSTSQAEEANWSGFKPAVGTAWVMP
jgi:hypothetical protein